MPRSALLVRRGAGLSVGLGVGGVMSVEIGAEGWYADLTFKGQPTGGTYNFGLGTNGDPDTGTPKLVFTVTSLGYDDTGAATTITRTIYGTHQVRKPYPNQLTNQETVFGTADVTVRVALSGYVFSKDKAGAGNSGTDVTVSVGAGLYTVGGVASLGGSVTATNSSTAAYQLVIANWSWPARYKAGATIVPRVLAFHHSGRQGRPVRAVRFTATGDTSGATVSQTVTTTTVDGTVGDAVPVPEYIGSLSTSGFTQGELVTVRAEAFPWVGDSTAVADSSTGPAAPSPLFGPRKVVCDKNGTYAASYAVVDPTSGSDATGTVKTGAVVGTTAYATIAGALNGIRTYNSSNYSRANRGGSTIYLRTGSHTWAGGTVTADSVAAETWCMFTRYPGDARSGVLISAQSGSKTQGLYTQFTDVTFTAQVAAGIFTLNSGSQIWFDQCEFNIPKPGSGSNVLVTIAASSPGIWHATRNLVTALHQGFRPNSTSNMPCALIRGNTWAGAPLNPALVYTCVGNAKTVTTATTGAAFIDGITGTTAPNADGMIFAFNKWVHQATNAPVAYFAGNTVASRTGAAIVQNLIESIGTVSNPALQVAADGSTNTPVDHVLLWHNVVVGERFSIGYNEVAASTTYDATARKDRRYWSVKNNIVDDCNVKSDIFSGSGYFQNAGKVGSWPVMYGVGHSGNMFAETTGIGAGGNFCHEFPGLKSRQGQQDQRILNGTQSGVDTTPNTLSYLAWVSRAAYDGSSAGAGNGDYHLQSSSPAKGMSRDWLLSHDIAGTARTAATDPGVYA